LINQYCQKGKQLYVEGRLKYDTWEDKNGGGKRSKHVVVVDNFQFLGGASRCGVLVAETPVAKATLVAAEVEADINRVRQRRDPIAAAPAARPPSAAPPAEQPFADEQQFKDDDIPF
jgi:single-strand DNA-binding protein